jgi:uncharacterized membrane protein YidH (DUF202 family)
MARNRTPSRRELARAQKKKETEKPNYKKWFILAMALFIVFLFIFQSLMPFF